MIKSQAVNLPPWKIVKWFPKVTSYLEKCIDQLKQVPIGETPSKLLLPTLHKHWQELTSEEGRTDEDSDDELEFAGSFRGIPLLPAWLVVDKHEQDQNTKTGKKKKLYTWAARTPEDCLEDMITLSSELKDALEDRFDRMVPKEVKTLAVIFDLEVLFEKFSKFTMDKGKLFISREDREDWETFGRVEFKEFYTYVCALLHVRAF